MAVLSIKCPFRALAWRKSSGSFRSDAIGEPLRSGAYRRCTIEQGNAFVGTNRTVALLSTRWIPAVRADGHAQDADRPAFETSWLRRVAEQKLK
jgi:hypothetical protein